MIALYFAVNKSPVTFLSNRLSTGLIRSERKLAHIDL
nr:MAG TPA: hypothetical protein [Caudoviricetes sp.]